MFVFLVLAAAIIPSSVSAQYGGSGTGSDSCTTNGESKPDSLNEAACFTCENKKWVWKECPSGNVFSKTSLKCEKKQSPPQKICNSGDIRPYSCDKTKYEVCASDGCSWVLYKCPAYYVFANGECRSAKTTVKAEVATTPAATQAPQPTTDSGICTESAGASGFKPDPLDCTKYYQCVHGYFLQRPCGPGTAWDQINLTCNYYDLVCKK